MTIPNYLHRPSLIAYIHGYIYALVLTAIPFAVVAFGDINRTANIILISLFAFVQMIVHLFYFLHYSKKRVPIEARIGLALAILIGFVLTAGTLWIMADLHSRMML